MVKSLPEQEQILFEAYIALQSGQFEKALSLVKLLESFEVAAELKPNYYGLSGEIKIAVRDYVNALRDLETALDLLQTAKNSTVLELERIRNLIGLCFYYQNQHQKALEQHQICLEKIQSGQIIDDRFCIKVYTNLANEYLLLNNLKQAITLYEQAITKIKNLEDKSLSKGEDNLNLAGIYWGLGLACRAQPDLAKAALHFSTSFDLYKKSQMLKLAGTVQNLLGWVLIEQKRLAEAEEILQESLKISLAENDLVNLSSVYINLAYLYYQKNEWRLGQEMAKEGISYCNLILDYQALAQALLQLAEIELAGSLSSSESIKNLIEEALIAIEQTNSIAYKHKIYYRASEAFEQLGDIKRATETVSQALNLRL